MTDAFVTLTIIAALGAVCTAEAADEIVWRDASTLTVEGRGWSDTPSFFCRLPSRAKEKVTEGVWGLSSHSAGIAIRFVSNSPQIRARWTLTSPNLAMNHMAATGVSGLDLYLRYNGGWRWLGVGRPEGQESEFPLINGLPQVEHEFMLYLPLHNGVSKVEIGVPAGSTVEPAPSRAAKKPIVFYGTSITQGGCAARPGMAYPAIIGRKLDMPTINLGFSGNGRCEHEMADLLAELDPSVYVIDPLPNMAEDTVDERIRYLLKTLHAKHPDTPVVLVENVIHQNSYALEGERHRDIRNNRLLAKVYKDVAGEWNGRLYYVKCTKLLGTDGEGTVDGVHATDVGFMRMADVMAPVISEAMSNAPSKP